MSMALFSREKGASVAPKPKAAANKSVKGLKTGEPHDAYEQEADYMVDELMTTGTAKREWSLSNISLEHQGASGSGLDHSVQQGTCVARERRPSSTEIHRKQRRNAEQKGEFGVVSLREAASNLAQAQRNREERILANGPVQFRVPTTADLKALFSSGQISESVLKDRIQVALTRMAAEKRLKTSDSVEDIMKKVFPAAGVFDEKAYEDAVDVTDRKQVYQSVLEAEAQVTSADKPKLKTAMQDASKLIDDCAADSTNLASVFGSKKDDAKNIYNKAKSALDTATTNIDSAVTIDYNLDDPEVGLGGWARFSAQKVHFTKRVAQVTDAAGAKITIIHESSHLADASVKDKGYYGSSGFEGMSEDEKVTNAAHYEEIPRRKLDKSKYKDPTGKFIDFKPDTSASGAPQTFDEQAKRKAEEYFRKAWDKAVDVDKFIRGIRKDQLGGDDKSFNDHKPRIMEISKLMHLTVHEQPAASAKINQLDVVLAEGVAHAAAAMIKVAKSQNVPNPVQLQSPPLNIGYKPPPMRLLDKKLELKPIPGLDPKFALPTIDDAANQVITATIVAQGSVVGGYFEDKALLDWLVAEYKQPL